MASKSIDWDELLLTNDPKKKQIEVSFKKIDGDGFLISKGDEGGTPGGVGEDPEGVVTPPINDEGDFEPGQDPGGTGEPIVPNETPEDCVPGNDCAARWDFEDIAGDFYSWHRDSVLWMRDGYEDHADGYFNYFGQSTDVDYRSGAPVSPSNAFTLIDQNGDEVYNGNATSQPPSMGAGPSSIYPYDGFVNDPQLRFTTPASPTNVEDENRNINTLQMHRRKWAELDPACGGGYFCAPNWRAHINERRMDTGTSIFPVTTEIYDPAVFPQGSVWVGVGAPVDGAEMEFEEWNSVYVTRPYAGATPLTDVYNILDPQWPTIEVSSLPSRHVFCHDSVIGGNQFQQNTYSGSSSIRISPIGTIDYYGSAGNGGNNWFDARIDLNEYLGPDRALDGWITCHTERYITAARKPTNESGDYGIYQYGVTLLNQTWATWYYNGKRITPRFLTSQFIRPQADTPGTFVPHDPNIPYHQYLELQGDQRPSYGTLNYMRNDFPQEFRALLEATQLTKPISASSRWDANFVDSGTVQSQYVQPQANQSSFLEVKTQGNSYDLPVLAYVDHSDIGKGFFGTQAFKNMMRMNPKSIPTYCERIPNNG